MSVKWMRERVEEAGLPQPKTIYWDKRKRGSRYKLVWSGDVAVGSRLEGSYRGFNIPPIVEEEYRPAAEEFESALSSVLPEADIQGYIAHGFMYGYNVAVTVHVEGAERHIPSFKELWHRKYGYTQG